MKQGWHRAGLRVVAASVLLGSLAGCVPLVVGGGALTTALVASDRRTAGMYLEDERIEQSASMKLRELLGDDGRASVTSYNRLVLVTGEVRTAAQKDAITRNVANVENVRNVVNEVQVVPFISSLTQRTKDTYITGKVKASLIDAKDLQANNIKVVTDMNVVYLMGIVTPREAKRSAEIARGVNDVLKVVRVYESISEDDLANYRLHQLAPVEKDRSAM